MSLEYGSKITALIDNDTYNAVMKHFHHGQQTLFLRKIFASLKKLIEKDKFGEVTDYLYKEECRYHLSSRSSEV